MRRRVSVCFERQTVSKDNWSKSAGIAAFLLQTKALDNVYILFFMNALILMRMSII